MQSCSVLFAVNRPENAGRLGTSMPYIRHLVYLGQINGDHPEILSQVPNNVLLTLQILTTASRGHTEDEVELFGNNTYDDSRKGGYAQ